MAHRDLLMGKSVNRVVVVSATKLEIFTFEKEIFFFFQFDFTANEIVK